PRAVAAGREIGSTEIGLRVEAVGQNAAVGNARDHPLYDRMVDAQHREAVERDVADETVEGLLQGGKVAVKIEVLWVDVGDNRDCRGQSGEGTVAFVGLDDHPVAFAEARVGAVSVDDAAVDYGRIETRGLQQRADHRGRCGFAVRAGDRDRPAQPHQFAEHFGAADDRDAPRPRGDNLRVVALDRRGDDHDLRGPQVFGGVPD